jgi:hypothetical protein
MRYLVFIYAKEIGASIDVLPLRQSFMMHTPLFAFDIARRLLLLLQINNVKSTKTTVPFQHTENTTARREYIRRCPCDWKGLARTWIAIANHPPITVLAASKLAANGHAFTIIMHSTTLTQ